MKALRMLARAKALHAGDVYGLLLFLSLKP
jgi:hypothetical protein